MSDRKVNERRERKKHKEREGASSSGTSPTAAAQPASAPGDESKPAADTSLMQDVSAAVMEVVGNAARSARVAVERAKVDAAFKRRMQLGGVVALLLCMAARVRAR